MQISMAGRIALITGGSKGLGYAMGMKFAECGAEVALVSRNKEEVARAAKEISTISSQRCLGYVGDVSNAADIETIFKQVTDDFGRVDVLVNNAGYAIPSTFDSTSMEDEEKFIRVLGISVIALSKIFIPKMIKNKHGKIMIVSSVAAFAPPSSIQTLYGPIKTFMNRFSESININYNHIGITSTAVCPGYTITEFHSSSGVQDEMDRVPSFLKKSAKRIAKEAKKKFTPAISLNKTLHLDDTEAIIEKNRSKQRTNKSRGNIKSLLSEDMFD